MVETVLTATANDVVRGVLLTLLLMIGSCVAVLAYQQVRQFHRDGMNRLRAYEQGSRPRLVSSNCRVVNADRDTRRHLKSVS